MGKSKNQLKIGSVLSYLQMAMNIIIGLVYTPIMIKILGKNEYGLYDTVASSIAMLSILSLGFNSGYIRYYSKYKKEKDENGINCLNALFLTIFIIIGLVSFACGIFLTFNLNLIFDKGLTPAEYSTARILMFLFTINLAISFPMSVFANIISAHERFIFLKSMAIVKNVFAPLITVPFLYLGYGSISIVIITLIVSIVVDVSYIAYSFRKLQVHFDFSGKYNHIFKGLFAYTVFIAINMVIDQINCNIDKVLLGRFKGTAVVAVYSVGYKLFHFYMLFSTAISGIFTPRVHRIVRTNENDKEVLGNELTQLFVKVGRIQFIILALISSGLVFWGKSFIALWAGDGFDDSYYVALLLILPGSIALIQNLGIEIQRAENKHQFRSIVYLIMAFCNLALSIYLCQIYGAIGSAIGTAIAYIVANGLIINIYYHKKCYIDIILFWKSIGRMCIGIIIPCFFGVILSRLFVVNSYFTLMIPVSIYSVIYFISMYFLGFNNFEKSLVKSFIRVVKR